MSQLEPDLKQLAGTLSPRRVLVAAGLLYLLPTLLIGWLWIPARLATAGQNNLGSALLLPFVALMLCQLACIIGLAITLYILPFRKHQQAQAEHIQKLPKPEQLVALQNELGRSKEQMQLVLDDNIRLREDSQSAATRGETLAHLLETVVKSTDDHIIVTDAAARITNISLPAAALLAIRPEDVVGTDSFRLLRFFDAHKDNPEEYPLVRVIEDVLDKASTAPFMTDVILLDSSSQRHRIMLTSQAILRTDGSVAGSLLRLQPNESANPLGGGLAQDR